MTFQDLFPLFVVAVFGTLLVALFTVSIWSAREPQAVRAKAARRQVAGHRR